MSQAGGTGARSPDGGAAAECERLYRANVGAVTAYFARRSTDPHTVADLTADTFVTVITSFGSFDPAKGTARAWVFGIARHVYTAPPPPREPVATGHSVRTTGRITGPGKGASVSVRVWGVPAGDILVIGLERSGHGTAAAGFLTSPPPPSPPAGPGGSGSGQVSG